MEISIRIESDSAIDEAFLLKNFIEKENLEGIEEVELERTSHQPGEQGLGRFIGNLIISLPDKLNLFKEFLTQINVFATKYDKRAHIKCGDVNIVIPTNKLTGEQIERIALQALQK